MTGLVPTNPLTALVPQENLKGKPTSIIQKNINAGGDVAGGNIDKSSIHINIPIPYQNDATLKQLLLQHEIEKSTDPEYREFSKELNRFFNKKLPEKFRDLETKLTDGKREFVIELAQDSKEKLTKKIEKYQHYQSAQDIYTYLLVNIRTSFVHQVQSKIKSGVFKEFEIDEIVANEIIGPFLFNLQGSSLLIDKDELYGVLYFLTGNCYIEWD